MKGFDANWTWDQNEACIECKSDDLREDHESDCDCYCHNPAKIRILESELALAKKELTESHQREERLFQTKLFADKISLDNLNLIKERDRYRDALEKICNSIKGPPDQHYDSKGSRLPCLAEQALAGEEK